MSLSIYEQLGKGDLKSKRMTLELANRSITHPVGIAEDVFVRLNSCTFPADFVVVNFEADPRVLLILGRPFLRTSKALVDHFEDTLTLRHDDDIMIFKADASKSKKHSVKSVDVCDYSFDDFVKTFVSESSPSFPPTKEYDSFWEEVDEFLAIETIPFSETGESYFDSEGDIIFLDNLLNDEPSIPPDKVKTKIELIIDNPLEPELEEFLPDFESFSFDTTEEMSGNPTHVLIFLIRLMKLFILISITRKRRVVAVPLLMLLSLFRSMSHFVLMNLNVKLKSFLVLNMKVSVLIVKLIMIRVVFLKTRVLMKILSHPSHPGKFLK
jgi:hypothetical protein